LAEGDGGTEQGEEQAGVDGMPDPAVRSGADQFMVLFQRDDAAPVAAEVDTGPDGKAKADDKKDGAHRDENR
jgi:hypothetical protein